MVSDIFQALWVFHTNPSLILQVSEPHNTIQYIILGKCQNKFYLVVVSIFYFQYSVFQVKFNNKLYNYSWHNIIRYSPAVWQVQIYVLLFTCNVVTEHEVTAG